MQPTITGPTLECRHCGKSNSLDSRFCKSCGAAVSDDDLQVARQKNQELIDEGIRLLAEGRADEACLIAEASIAADPENPRAHAFLGDCLEQGDDISGALAAYERVVELAPDSALDKIRVAHLRKMLAARSLEVSVPPDRRKALLAGTLATIFVGSLGTVLAILNASPANSPETAGSVSTTQTQQSPVARSETPPVGSSDRSDVQTPANEVSQETGSQPVQQPAGSSGAQSRVGVPPVPRGNGTMQLPYPRTDGSVAEVGGTAPLVPPIEGDIRVTPDAGARTTAPTKAASTTPDRSTDPDPTPNPVAPDAKKPPANPGIIEITPSKGQTRPRIGGSEPIESGRAETLLRVARQHYLIGNYSGAADAYVKALAGGAEPGLTNQRLAQAYERLGRRSEAAAAYARAIRILEAESSPSPARKAALEACRQAAKVLGG